MPRRRTVMQLQLSQLLEIEAAEKKKLTRLCCHLTIVASGKRKNLHQIRKVTVIRTGSAERLVFID